MTTQPYVLIGAGGTGSILFPLLVRYLDSYHGNRGDNHIVAVIDGDHVEAKNLERQMFGGNFIDENKAHALVAQLGHPATRAVPEYLGEENLEKRIFDGDVVLIAADNYDVRRRIERHAMSLGNIVVINGGNESSNGSLQVFIRSEGVNLTPLLSWQHPEILEPSPHDPSAMNCQQIAEMPGGEQTIVANTMSAAWMLNALVQYHEWNRVRLVPGAEIPIPAPEPFPWHELHFDLATGRARPNDLRGISGWEAYSPVERPRELAVA